MSDLASAVAEARERFLNLVATVRPELHRYCTRMTGSVFDGEDVVQDTLAKAWYALAELESEPPLRPWLFRIAHNAALDFLRRYEHRHVELVADFADAPELDPPSADETRVEAALELFATLPPVQRSALALKDVLGLSLEETAHTMDTSVASVKAALVRARVNIGRAARPGVTRAPLANLAQFRRYAELFNARDWDGLRALFGEETRLDVVSRSQRRGPPAAQYFTYYQRLAPLEQLRAEAGFVGGQPILAVFRPTSPDRPAYFIQLSWQGDEIAQIRDFRYVPYIAGDAIFTT